MKFIGSILFVLALAITCSASDGYTLGANGYYTYGSSPQLYYRSLETIPGYWLNGCYVRGYQRYVYYAHTLPAVATPAALPAYDAPNAVDALLKIKLAEIDQQTKVTTFVNAAHALGMSSRLQDVPYPLAQPFRQPGVPYAQNGLSGHYYQNYATGGATQYAYNPIQYGTLDINQLNLMQAQLTQSVQDAAQKSFGLHTQTVDNMNQGAIKVAEINARTAFAVATLNALSTEPKLQSQGFKFQIDAGGSNIRLMAPVDADAGAWEKEATAFVSQACASCHSGPNLKGGFDVGNWAQLTQAQRDKIIVERVTTPDLSRRMPRKADGSVGPAITGKNLLMLRTPKL